MLKAFKYRILPTREQETLINKHIGSARFIYNLALETKQMAYAGNRVNLDCFSLIKQLPDLKQECTWLKEINSQSLQQPIRNLDNAFTQFFKGQGNFPKFKKKSNGGSFNVPQSVVLDNSLLMLPKFREGIKIILHRSTKGVIRQATISRTPTGKYFASILCDTGENIKEKSEILESETVGIDLGIKTFLVASDGKSFDNPRFLERSISKLKFTHRKYSTRKGKRTKHKLAKLHEKVANQRRDFLQKVSTQLIRDNQSLAIETLQIPNMLKNRKLSRAIKDVGWGEFVDMLEYKAEWYGKNILKIGTFEPSSKLHNKCGYLNKQLTLSDREWLCPKCNEVVLRDINAAINIKNFALKNHLSGEHRLKNRNELPTLVGVLTSEAHS